MFKNYIWPDQNYFSKWFYPDKTRIPAAFGQFISRMGKTLYLATTIIYRRKPPANLHKHSIFVFFRSIYPLKRYRYLSLTFHLWEIITVWFPLIIFFLFNIIQIIRQNLIIAKIRWNPCLVYVSSDFKQFRKYVWMNEIYFFAHFVEKHLFFNTFFYDPFFLARNLFCRNFF